MPPFFLVTEACPLVNRTLKNHTKLVWSILITHEQTHLRKTTRYSVWSQHFFEKSLSACDEEKSVNLSKTWLDHVFSIFLSSDPKAFAMSKLSPTNETLSVDNVLPVPSVKPLPPPSDVLIGIRSNTTIILATLPPEKEPRCHAFQKSHIPCTKRHGSKPTFPGFGMTHPLERC